MMDRECQEAPLEPIDAWHFITQNRRMSFNVHSLIEAGQTYRVEGKPILCEHGLHASRKALDALSYAPGPIICCVRLGGVIVESDDKLVATERTVIWIADATTVLGDYARWCALSVAEHWDMPSVVQRYLETGNERLRDAAWSAASAAASAADRDTDRDEKNNELEKRLNILAKDKNG